MVFVCDDRVIITTDGFAAMSRQDLLSLAAALQADIPAHVTTEAPYVQCDRCGRKSYNAFEMQRCGSMQRMGQLPCDGLFRKPAKGALYPKPLGV